MTALEQVEARIAASYGPAASAQMQAFGGLLHVAAVWAGTEDWPALLIRPDSPRSPGDRFALELARARADAIVVTGKIVREESELRYDPPATGTPYAEGLARWRRERLAKAEPPRVVVLSSGRDLDLDHGVFHSWARPVLMVAEANAASLREGLAARGMQARVELWAEAQPTLAGTLARLRAQGCATICLEAGPQTLAPLYRASHDGAQIDELMLSLFEGALPEHLRGGSFVARERVQQTLVRLSSQRVEEPSGPWTFTRWVRAGASSSTASR